MSLSISLCGAQARESSERASPVSNSLPRTLQFSFAKFQRSVLESRLEARAYAALRLNVKCFGRGFSVGRVRTPLNIGRIYLAPSLKIPCNCLRDPATAITYFRAQACAIFFLRGEGRVYARERVEPSPFAPPLAPDTFSARLNPRGSTGGRGCFLAFTAPGTKLQGRSRGVIGRRGFGRKLR